MAGPAVIADAYDLYADQLYAYCRFFARDPADAVDVLENIFLVAAGRGAALPLDGQLRAWLFAVARNECLRRSWSRRASRGTGREPGGTAEGRAGREPLAAAAGRLAPGDRDLVALLWHGLDADDIAAVLGIAREESLARLETALDRLEEAAKALPTAGAGCQKELAAQLGVRVSAEALRPAAGVVAEFRDEVLSLACDPSARGAAARRQACGLAGPFGLSLPQSGDGDRSQWTGFPVPLPADPARGVPRNRLAMALTGTAAVALAVTAGLAAAGEPGRGPQPAAAEASLTPAIGVPPAVTLRWNASRGELEGSLTVTVRGGTLAWSVSDRDRGLRLSRDSGNSSATVRITGRPDSDLRPLSVTAGNATYTVTLTAGR